MRQANEGDSSGDDAGGDEEDDDDNEDVAERRARLAAENEFADEDEEETNRNEHLIELRRQAMIESLIGMGFPIDWALRAAEHCDVSTSESAAISWIIERMELEQNKLDDAEGDSR